MKVRNCLWWDKCSAADRIKRDCYSGETKREYQKPDWQYSGFVFSG